EELQMLIDGLGRNNETVAKYLQEYYLFAAEFPIERRIELISDLKQFQDFIHIGSKEEAERFKRKGVRLEQDSYKKLKTLEEVPEEKLKEMMELILVEEVYVEALQVKHPIIDWEVHIEGERSYWKIVSDEFLLPEQLPTTYEDKFPLLIQSDATVKKIALLLKTGVKENLKKDKIGSKQEAWRRREKSEAV
nr:hypothetical protein [Tanacetum cinerariifolium]